MGVTSKMTRMVLLYMLILSMVSLPTSLARNECTDFLEQALEVLVEEDSAWKSMGPHILDGLNAVMEKPNKGEDYGRPSAPPPSSTSITFSKSLVGRLGTGRLR